MALQTSGAISLNDIHVEAGGTTGTSASINDADIRDLIDKASGAQSSFSEFYGASAVAPFASWTTSFGNIQVTTEGTIQISSAPYTNTTIPLRGGYNVPMGNAIVGGNGYIGLNLPTITRSAALASNPVYQFYLSLSPTQLVSQTGVDILGNPATDTFWALDPVDFGYQSATYQGLTVTFNEATTADIPAADQYGRITRVYGLAIRRQQFSGNDQWYINLGGTVTGTAINGEAWQDGNGFDSGNVSVTGTTLTMNGYS